ncbi:MAG: hypothetical protein WC551_08375 [Patescibacteria group bacterium]
MLNLGSGLITIDHRVVGIVDNMTVDMDMEGTDPEELQKLQRAKCITIVRPSQITLEATEKHSRVPVSSERFGERLQVNFHSQYVLLLEGWQVAIIHGLMAITSDHPGVKGLHESTHQAIRYLRDWCQAVFIDWGLSPDEARYLDAMRQAAGGDMAKEQTCRGCGCTNTTPCMTAEGPCHWAEDDLCSACASQEVVHETS